MTQQWNELADSVITKGRRTRTDVWLPNGNLKVTPGLHRAISEAVYLLSGDDMVKLARYADGSNTSPVKAEDALRVLGGTSNTCFGTVLAGAEAALLMLIVERLEAPRGASV